MANSRAFVYRWSNQLGLLPIPLRSDEDVERFVLMNGAAGNFCLSDKKDEGSDARRAAAWSTNVGHFITLAGQDIEVLRHDESSGSIERYSLASVEQNLEKFHTYLETSQPRDSQSVIAHATRVFRQLRSVCNVESGRQPLAIFLALLARCADQANEREFSSSNWKLPPRAEEDCLSLGALDIEMFENDLLKGRSIEGLELKPDLLLRHAAGQLFQEAHYEASIAHQLRFAGFSPVLSQAKPSSAAAGVHFTPPSLARTLVEQALRFVDLGKHTVTIFDPACGSGEFLRESIRQLRLKDYEGLVRVIGWDISQTACDMARFVLGWEKARDKRSIEVDIHQTDSLALPWPSDVNALLMNPPFISYESLGHEQRETMKSAMGDLAKGRFDLSTAFVWKAATSLQKGSVLAAIVPGSLLESKSALGVRTAIGRQMGLHLVARLGSQTLFTNALVDASAFVGQIGFGGEHETTAFWADYRSTSTSAGLRALRRASKLDLSSPVVSQGYSIYPVPSLEQEPATWAPRAFQTRELLMKLETFSKVADLFTIRSGARSGHLPAFVIPKGALKKLPEREQRYFRPAILNGSVRAGQLLDDRYTFYPYGRMHLTNENHLKTELPIFYQEVLAKKEPKLRERKSKREAERWWEMSEPRTWQFEPQPKLISVSFGDAGSFAYDETGEYVVMQGYCWQPKRSMKLAMRSEADLVFAYVAVLNSDLMSKLLAATSNQVQGGQWDLSSRFLSKVPLPDLSRIRDRQLIKDLAHAGKLIVEGESWETGEAARAVEAVYALWRS